MRCSASRAFSRCSVPWLIATAGRGDSSCRGRHRLICSIKAVSRSPAASLTLTSNRSANDEVAAHGDLMQHWLRGGFPESFLAADEAASYRWRERFVRTITRCIDILESTFMVRLLRPFFRNTKKRLVRSPKIYLRDSGLLHTLLGLRSWDALFGHPAIGASWEAYALEQILGVLQEWKGSFYRSSGGAEIDLVLERGGQTVAVEFKSTGSPRVSKGFYQAADDIQADERYIVAPLSQPELIPYGHGAVLCRPESLIRRLSAL